jgi:hypothetical protein
LVCAWLRWIRNLDELDAIDGRGLNGVSIPEIMKAAKLTHGPFYNHFASTALVEGKPEANARAHAGVPHDPVDHFRDKRFPGLMAICVGLVQSERVVSAAQGPPSRVEPWSLLVELSPAPTNVVRRETSPRRSTTGTTRGTVVAAGVPTTSRQKGHYET